MSIQRPIRFALGLAAALATLAAAQATLGVPSHAFQPQAPAGSNVD